MRKLPVNRPKTNRNYDLRRLLKPHESKWVALSYDQRRVLGAGKTLQEAKRKAQAKKEPFIFIKLPPYHVSYTPTI